MKGCYVYFEDAATREFFLGHLKAESASTVTMQSARNPKTNGHQY